MLLWHSPSCLSMTAEGMQDEHGKETGKSMLLAFMCEADAHAMSKKVGCCWSGCWWLIELAVMAAMFAGEGRQWEHGLIYSCVEAWCQRGLQGCGEPALAQPGPA